MSGAGDRGGELGLCLILGGWVQYVFCFVQGGMLQGGISTAFGYAAG
jgi:hypothetical protein